MCAKRFLPMWITQTYLGAAEPDAKLFIYYLFENYNKEQRSFTQRIQRELEGLGEIFRSDVSLLMPNPRYAGRIEAEVRENRELWESLYRKLPGLLISTEPLAFTRGYGDDCLFIPFLGRDPKDVAFTIQKVRELASNKISWDFAQQSPPTRQTFLERLLESVELKPGFGGIRVDIRKLSRW